MVDDESANWWKPNDTRPLTFEQRIPQVMIPNMGAKGLNPKRKPDLIVLSSLFWDENYIGGVSRTQIYEFSIERNTNRSPYTTTST